MNTDSGRQAGALLNCFGLGGVIPDPVDLMGIDEIFLRECDLGNPLNSETWLFRPDDFVVFEGPNPEVLVERGRNDKPFDLKACDTGCIHVNEDAPHVERDGLYVVGNSVERRIWFL